MLEARDMGGKKKTMVFTLMTYILSLKYDGKFQPSEDGN